LPTINLSGGSDITIDCGSAYVDAGVASVTDLCGSGIAANLVANGVNTASTGDYTVTYEANDGSGNIAQAVRTVRVRDLTAPLINLVDADTVNVPCGTPYVDAGATVTELCGLGGNTLLVTNNVDHTNPGTYSVVYNIQDQAGNNALAKTRTVIVEDILGPVIDFGGLQDITIECHSTFTDPGATVTDLCEGVLSGVLGVTGTVDANTPGDYTLTYTAQDSGGRSATPKDRIVHVVDSIKPVINLVGGAVQLECGDTFVEPGVSLSEACDLTLGVTSDAAAVLLAATGPGDYTISYSAVGSGINVADVVTRTVTILDSVAPVITLIDSDDVTISCGSAYIDAGVASVTDDCAGALTATLLSNNVNTAAPGDYTVVYTATDGTNVATKTRNVHVVDSTDPIITLNDSDDITINCGDAYVDAGVASATDECAGTLGATLFSSDVNTTTPGDYTVVYRTTDGTNTVDKIRNVHVVDSTAPVITLNDSDDITINCGDAYTDAGVASVTDACATGLTATLRSNDVNTTAPGNYTVVYEASDGTNTATKTRNVHVVDSTNPVITLSGSSDVTINCGDTYTDAGVFDATDGCAGTLTATLLSNNVDTTTPGDYTVVYQASDGTNNVTATRDVHVVDSTAPVITLEGLDDVTIDCGTSYTDAGVKSATDGCAGALTATLLSNNVDTTTPGDYTVVYQASDGTNNATATRDVHVVDTADPVIVLNGSDEVTINCGDNYTDAGVLDANDSCAGALTATLRSNTVTTGSPGDYAVVYEATDGTNTITKTRIVHVVDSTDPVIALNGPDDVNVECGTAYTDAGVNNTTDACAGALPATLLSNDVDTTTPGDYTVVYQANDGINTITKTRNVHVVDTTDPTITLNGDDEITIDCGEPLHRRWRRRRL
jgi:hypothetical protein